MDEGEGGGFVGISGIRRARGEACTERMEEKSVKQGSVGARQGALDVALGHRFFFGAKQRGAADL